MIVPVSVTANVDDANSDVVGGVNADVGDDVDVNVKDVCKSLAYWRDDEKKDSTEDGKTDDERESNIDDVAEDEDVVVVVDDDGWREKQASISRMPIQSAYTISTPKED